MNPHPLRAKNHMEFLEREKIDYDTFIREALTASFTDPQINFLEKWLFDELRHPIRTYPTPPESKKKQL